MDDIQAAVIEIVQREVSSEVTIDSHTGNTEDWDSLAAISILQGLDDRWDGITSRNPALSSMGSVADIVKVVTDDTV